MIDPDILIPAYDDAAGVTAEFNRNILRVLNHRLGADFETGQFAHVALWDPDNEWIEMRLQAACDTVVTIRDLDLTLRFDRNEQLRTEISAKLRLPGLRGELSTAGFDTARTWIDPDARYALVLAERR